MEGTPKTTDIKCPKCYASVRIGNIIKVKEKYVCPYCFTTLKKISTQKDLLNK